MVGLGQPQLPARFEVANLSRCTIFLKKGTQKILGAPIAQGHVHSFFGVGFYDGIWQTPSSSKI